MLRVSKVTRVELSPEAGQRKRHRRRCTYQNFVCASKVLRGPRSSYPDTGHVHLACPYVQDGGSINDPFIWCFLHRERDQKTTLEPRTTEHAYHHKLHARGLMVAISAEHAFHRNGVFAAATGIPARCMHARPFSYPVRRQRIEDHASLDGHAAGTSHTCLFGARPAGIAATHTHTHAERDKLTPGEQRSALRLSVQRGSKAQQHRVRARSPWEAFALNSSMLRHKQSAA
jgi:hypothetical protein